RIELDRSIAGSCGLIARAQAAESGRSDAPGARERGLKLEGAVAREDRFLVSANRIELESLKQPAACVVRRERERSAAAFDRFVVAAQLPQALGLGNPVASLAAHRHQLLGRRERSDEIAAPDRGVVLGGAFGDARIIAVVRGPPKRGDRILHFDYRSRRKTGQTLLQVGRRIPEAKEVDQQSDRLAPMLLDLDGKPHERLTKLVVTLAADAERPNVTLL